MSQRDGEDQDNVEEGELLLRAQRRASELGMLVTTRKAHHSSQASHHEKMVAELEIASKQLQVMLQKMIRSTLGQEQLSVDYVMSCNKVFDDIENLVQKDGVVAATVSKIPTDTQATMISKKNKTSPVRSPQKAPMLRDNSTLFLEGDPNDHVSVLKKQKLFRLPFRKHV